MGTDLGESEHQNTAGSWPLRMATTSAIYSASGQTDNSRIVLMDEGLNLHVRGQIFGTVVGTFSIRSNEEPLFKKLRALMAWYRTSSDDWNVPRRGCRYNTSGDTEENILRTIMADQWPLGQRAGAQRFSRPPEVGLEDFLHKFQCAGRHQQPVFLSERIFILTSDGSLGLGPHEAKTGDEIAVLEGGSVPYVLRPRHPGAGYTFIGEW